MVKDYNNVSYESVETMCRVHHVNPKTYVRRMKRSNGDIRFSLGGYLKRSDQNLLPCFKRLKELRWAHGLYQTELASKAGITKGVYIQTEEGYRNLTIVNLVKLSIYYQVSSDYIVGISGVMAPKSRNQTSIILSVES